MSLTNKVGKCTVSINCQYHAPNKGLCMAFLAFAIFIASCNVYHTWVFVYDTVCAVTNLVSWLALKGLSSSTCIDSADVFKLCGCVISFSRSILE